MLDAKTKYVVLRSGILILIFIVESFHSFHFAERECFLFFWEFPAFILDVVGRTVTIPLLCTASRLCGELRMTHIAL